MSITWQEREHEEKYMVALNDPGTVEALKNCGLLQIVRNEAIIRTIAVPSSCMGSDESGFSHKGQSYPYYD